MSEDWFTKSRIGWQRRWLLLRAHPACMSDTNEVQQRFAIELWVLSKRIILPILEIRSQLRSVWTLCFPCGVVSADQRLQFRMHEAGRPQRSVC